MTRRLILLLPVAFLAHDLGELAGNDEPNRTAEDLSRRPPVPAEQILPRFTTQRAQATVAIGTLATGVTGLSWRATRSAPRQPTMTAHAAATLLVPAVLGVERVLYRGRARVRPIPAAVACGLSGLAAGRRAPGRAGCPLISRSFGPLSGLHLSEQAAAGRVEKASR